MRRFEVLSTHDGVVRLHLLGRPCVEDARDAVAVPQGSQRLAAYVALHGRSVDRREAAAVLWPDVDAARAAGNLRSALWRLRSCGGDVLDSDACVVVMNPAVSVDVDDVDGWATRVIEGRALPTDLVVDPLAMHALDLLPCWYDDWVCETRQRLRTRLLIAIEALVGVLLQARHVARAVEVALDVVHVEPLRESAQRALIVAHLAEGNRWEAWRSLMAYDRLLQRELGVRAPADLHRLVASPRPGAPGGAVGGRAIVDLREPALSRR